MAITKGGIGLLISMLEKLNLTSLITVAIDVKMGGGGLFFRKNQPLKSDSHLPKKIALFASLKVF